MAYIVYLDGVTLPVTPSKIQMKIKNQNKTINLINDGEVNILKSAGLTEIDFTVMIPHTRFPFGYYPLGFQEASFYLDKLEALKVDQIPFQFITSRTSPAGSLLFDTNLKVSLESYNINEDAKEGQSISVDISLKQYKDYGTKVVTVETKSAGTVASVKTTRSTANAPIVKTYKVKAGDTLWAIAKAHLGNGSRYSEIASLNNLSNPNLILVGQVLTMPT